MQAIPLQSSVGAIKDLPIARQAQPTGYAASSAGPQRLTTGVRPRPITTDKSVD
jgi:hypothetical protein